MNDLDIAIQKRVDAEVAKRLASVFKRVGALQVAVDKLHDDLAKLTDSAGAPQGNGAAAAEKKSRAPIKLGPQDRYDVFHILNSAPAMNFTIADIRRELKDRLSGRVIGAALRQIVAGGDAVEVKGKFRAAPVVALAEVEGDVDGDNL